VTHAQKWASYCAVYRLKIRIRILPVRSAEKIRSDHPHFTRYKIRRSAGPQIRILPKAEEY